MEVSEFVRLE
ncbi:hypothetical protein CGLO_09824 [Colletotrichum gloeosporioides Cg-14]|uniref:Uncharacterized protein n=1 Tax=Colletotrichum gloeosporioides (strain Cg-14) TaxID=1237896 RepID=T0KCP0_COLGC|nr:hypothetical protein CGLO_09824 [Colletotrichum gloeosporioides Cg-14]